MQADIQVDTAADSSAPQEAVLILTTQGRYSGKSDVAMLSYRRINNDFIVVATSSNDNFKPDWFLNLKEEPIVHLEIRDAKFYARATTPTGRSRLNLLPVAKELLQQLDNRIPRATSVVSLTPMC